MIFPEIFTASIISIIAGLDRTAALQFMICRPIVAAPLTGWALGVPLVGLEVGLLVELLWLCCLPVGTAIPPDDTQVAIAATFLAGMGESQVEASLLSLVVLSVFFCCPLGKTGQVFDGWARRFNSRLSEDAQAAIAKGNVNLIGRYHLKGLLSFGLASWASFLVIALSGAAFLFLFFSVFKLGKSLDPVSELLRILFPLLGSAAILANMKIRRSLTLYLASFVSTLTFLWFI
jgi:mannose/fructose/N-acetylgalactosamine-specific phosphotransferase system component IIC